MIRNNTMKLHKLLQVSTYRTFKKFGHKREPIPLVTTVWHGFLTLSFIGLGLNWEKLNIYLFDDQNIVLVEPPKFRRDND